MALAARMDSRDLSSANEEFNSFGQGHASGRRSHDAVVGQAEANAMARRHSSGTEGAAVPAARGGNFPQDRGCVRPPGRWWWRRGGGAGRDLASLFDLELDTEKNQYETAQTGSAADQRAKAVDDALQKLDALARRQEELAKQQRNSAQTMQERWQQEMLRREAEQLQRQMEQMAQNGQPQKGSKVSKDNKASRDNRANKVNKEQGSEWFLEWIVFGGLLRPIAVCPVSRIARSIAIEWEWRCIRPACDPGTEPAAQRR